MRLGEELRDPWSMVVGGLAGGLGWAVGIPALAAAAVGAGVWGAKAIAAALVDRTGRDEPAPGRPGPPQIKPGSPEAEWVRRSERATETFRRLAAEAPTGPVSDRAELIGEEAATTLEGIKRLASQASAVTSAMNRVDARRLSEEEQRLKDRREKATLDALRREIDRSLDSLADQKAVRGRLEDARETVLARLEATVLDVESLVARLVEVLALVETQSPDESASRIGEMENELEGLRNGLAETEELSRNVLSQVTDSSSVTTAEPRRSRRSRGRGDPDAQGP